MSEFADLPQSILDEADKVLKENPVKVGTKHDDGKLPWHLLPWREVEEVVRVLKHGADKYGEENWKSLEYPQQRYFSAAQRHLVAWWTARSDSETRDRESRLNHLAHAACCLLFILHFERSRKDVIDGSA